MKTSVFIIFLLVYQSFFAYSQVYEVVEKPAQFEGGMKVFYKYLSKNLKISKKDMNKGFYNGKFLVEFIVEKDGSLSNIKVLRGNVNGTNFIKVFKNCPKWQPAYHKGKPVRMKMKLPILISFS